MIERTADICVKVEMYQNNLENTQDTFSKTYQENLKNLTDTESDDENLYICNVEPPGSAYISAKVFSCPLWEIRSFQRQKVRYLFPLVHVHAVSRVSAVVVLHICRVWSISVVSLSRPCEAPHKIRKWLHTFVIL